MYITCAIDTGTLAVESRVTLELFVIEEVRYTSGVLLGLRRLGTT